MITHISIRDFAIIRDLSIDLYPGLNIITGETGAGKSIIIEAVSMALGARADTQYVRTGAEKAVITLMADSEDPAVLSILDDMGAPSDMPMVIRREISAAGKSAARVNGTIVPLSDLSRLCGRLADIHGQYDHQYLLDPDNHVKVLDMLGGEAAKAGLSKVAEAYGRYVEVSERLRALKARLEDSRRKRELLEYEVSEIDKAALSPGEDDKLREEIAMIQHSEQIFEAVSESYEALFGGEGGADLALGNAMNRLSLVSGFSQEIGEIEAAVSDAYYQIEDLSSRLRKVRDSVSFSEAELDTKTERLELIEALKRKYGGSLTAVLEYADKARQELKLIDSADDELKALEAGISEAKASYVDAANKLTAIRKKAASELETGMAKELAELAFADARLLVKLGLSAPSARGSDAVEFLMSANRGEEPRPLAKIASGGELSRIMLAFKRMIGDLDDIPTMIFDEIDTGISGATAGVVGKKLKEISKTHQIVCITHLPQIACQADRHFRIAKYSDEISTHTTVDPLGETERIDEIARLLSASEITEAARAQARVLIASASTGS